MIGRRQYEVLVIGGGVIGLSIARELSVQGVRHIAVVDSGSCGLEASWAAAGMLSPQAECDADDDFFRFCTESRDMWPNFAESLIEETGVDSEFDQSGTLSLAFTEEQNRILAARSAWQESAGFAAEILTRGEMLALEPSLNPALIGGAFFANDWQVENRKLLAALIAAAKLRKIDLIENLTVRRLTSVAGAVEIKSDVETFHAQQAVIATGAWTSLIKTTPFDMNVPVLPIRGQMISMRPAERLFSHVIYGPDGYLVPRADGRVLVGSTSEDVGFDRNSTEAAEDELKAVASRLVPALTDQRVAERWAGLRPFAPDGLPILGEIDGIESVFAATAHYRNGILLSPITAKIIAERMVRGTGSRYFKPFGVHRFSQSLTACK